MSIPTYIKWLLAIAGVVWCGFEATDKGDFFIYCYAASDLHDGIDIYTKTYINGYHYYYSLAFALLLKPFLGLPFFGVKWVWLLINLSAYLHLFYLVLQSQWIKAFSEQRQKWFALLLFLLTFRVMHDNIHTSQITLILLWLTVYGMVSIENGRDLKGGLLLAIGVNIKLMPLVMVPYLLYRGYFKAVGVFVVGLLALFVLPGAVIGWDYNFFLLEQWWLLINPAGTRHVLDTDERSFHSLTTLLSTLFVENVPDSYAMPLKRNIADVSLSTLSTIILVARLVLISFSLYFLRWTPFKKRNGSVVFFEISYLLMVVPLIFPHQQSYGFVFTAPAMACVLWVVMKQGVHLKDVRWVQICLVLVFLLYSLKIILGEFNNYYDHFKILTYGALVLIPLLVWAYRTEVMHQRTIAH